LAKRRELEGASTATKDHELLLTQIKTMLREREPNLEQLMELSLKKERDQQERKDAKVLEILKIKDKQIEELQGRSVV
jgi:hypothetical protein